MKTICWDLDGVLFDYVGTLCTYMSWRFPRDDGRPRLTLDMIKAYDLRLLDTILTPEMMKEMWRVTGDPRWVYNVKPFQDAMKALVRLSDKYRFATITSRMPKMKKITLAAFDNHFSGLFNPDHHYHSKSKARICRTYHGIAVDDNPTEILKHIKARNHAWVMQTNYTGSSIPHSRFVKYTTSMKDLADKLLREENVNL